MIAWFVRWWKLLALMLGLFMAGAVTGGVVTVVVIRKAIETQLLDSATWGDRAMQRLDARLNLTPEQEAEIRPIIDQAVSELRIVRDQALEDMGGVMAVAAVEITGKLTPEQQREFEKLREERQRIAQSFMERVK
jgi:Spy/CpxP family protein refolding chaperone